MFTAYKCRTCGSVSKEHQHLCQADEMHSRTEYCATEMMHDSRPDCEPMNAAALYTCEGCGRSTDEPKLVCRPQKVG